MKRYAIPYKGLSIGNHHFEFEVDDRFFDAFEGSEIHRGHASVSVELVKTERLLTLDFTIDGEAEVTCDRCLDEFMMPVHYAGTLQVRFSETEKESDGEVMWLSPNETELPLGQYIYESISLSLPYRKIHPEDAEGHSLCNPEMLSRFRIVSEEEFEQFVQQTAAEAATENAPAQDGDSPWSELETLKKKLEQEQQKNLIKSYIIKTFSTWHILNIKSPVREETREEPITKPPFPHWRPARTAARPSFTTGFAPSAAIIGAV